jgi:transposase
MCRHTRAEDRITHRTSWQYSRPGGTIVFDFRLGRGRDGPKRFLGQFEGILQTDGYTAYDQIGGPRMVHAACWVHARRQFFEAAQLNPRDPVATPIVARMDELFSVDATARRKALTTAARHVLRQETARPLLDDIRSKIEAAQSVALPLERTQQGLQVRAHALEEAHPRLGASRIRAEY